MVEVVVNVDKAVVDRHGHGLDPWRNTQVHEVTDSADVEYLWLRLLHSWEDRIASSNHNITDVAGETNDIPPRNLQTPETYLFSLSW